MIIRFEFQRLLAETSRHLDQFRRSFASVHSTLLVLSSHSSTCSNDCHSYRVEHSRSAPVRNPRANLPTAPAYPSYTPQICFITNMPQVLQRTTPFAVSHSLSSFYHDQSILSRIRQWLVGGRKLRMVLKRYRGREFASWHLSESGGTKASTLIIGQNDHPRRRWCCPRLSLCNQHPIQAGPTQRSPRLVESRIPRV